MKNPQQNLVMSLVVTMAGWTAACGPVGEANSSGLRKPAGNAPNIANLTYGATVPASAVPPLNPQPEPAAVPAAATPGPVAETTSEPAEPAPGGDYFARWNFLNNVHGAIFAGTVYQHTGGNQVPTIDYWTRRYNPANGIGCRAIVQAFLLAHPSRDYAKQAIGARVPITVPTAGALFNYIVMQFAAELPGVDNSPAYTIIGWASDGQIGMDGIDSLFLDHPVFKNYCASAGLTY